MDCQAVRRVGAGNHDAREEQHEEADLCQHELQGGHGEGPTFHFAGQEEPATSAMEALRRADTMPGSYAEVGDEVSR